MKRTLLVLPACLLLNLAFGQNLPELDEDDKKDIANQVENHLFLYQGLLNQLIAMRHGDQEAKNLVENSFSQTSNNQLFHEEAVIEDSKNASVPVKTYLNNFQQYYYDKVSGLEIKDIRSKTFTIDKGYQSVYSFETVFSKDGQPSNTYPQAATYTVERVKGKWKVLIQKIVFSTSEVPELEILTPLAPTAPIVLNEAESNQLNRQVQLKIDKYDAILDQLISPYTSDWASTEIIQDHISNASGNQLFHQDAVIEDNRSTADTVDTKVEEYLNNFRLFYKTEVSQVSIEDVQNATDIIPGGEENTYILTPTFRIDFLKGGDLFKTEYRKVTFTAQNEGSEWKMLIKSIVFNKNVIPETRNPPPDPVSFNGWDLDALFTLAPLSFTVHSVPYSPAKFRSMPEAMKWKKTYRIAWDNNLQPQTLWLYRDETLQQTLAQTTSGNTVDWTVPKKVSGQKIQPGQGYHFRLYNPNTKMTAVSGNFSIKRKIPLGLQIPVYIGIAGGIGYFIYKACCDPEPPECENCLPGPEELNPYGF